MTYNVFGGTFNLAQLPLQLGEGPDTLLDRTLLDRSPRTYGR